MNGIVHFEFFSLSLRHREAPMIQVSVSYVDLDSFGGDLFGMEKVLGRFFLQ